jgi:hypothetical protein
LAPVIDSMAVAAAVTVDAHKVPHVGRRHVKKLPHYHGCIDLGDGDYLS